ncbi:MAG: protease modulator HflC [Deferribacterota bacterium]|nr:protease modulator HflC [Deferribacterota bacterium]
MKNSLVIISVLLLLMIILLINALFTVEVSEQVIITQMGEPVNVIKDPGLKMKIPFIQKVNTLSKKLLEYDAEPAEIITKDKKILVVDNYCKWRIVDPLRFYLTVRDMERALTRIDDIIYSEMRIELANHNLSSVISENRKKIMHNVTTLSRKKAEEYGVYIDDVRIKRADLPKENEERVFDRMRSERIRIAKRYRSEGKEEAAKIRSRTDKERRVIIAEAYRKMEEIKGKADAQVIKITSKAYSKDPEFYNYMKSLEVYNKIIDNSSHLFLSTDDKLFNYLFIK